MSGAHHRPKHLRPSEPGPCGATWARSMLAASLLIGVAGVMAFRPTTTTAEATRTTDDDRPGRRRRGRSPPARGRRWRIGPASSWCRPPRGHHRRPPLVDRLAEIGVGGVMLRDDNIADEEQARTLIAGLRERLGPDLLVAVDDEGGRVTSMGALGQTVRSARRLGQEGPTAAEAAGRELGDLAASLGIDWVFAPGRRPRRRPRGRRDRRPLLRRRPGGRGRRRRGLRRRAPRRRAWP